MIDALSLLQKILLYGIPLLFAITIHEVAHGWVANRLGDATAKILGRLTLNPIKHIDILGTIILPTLLMLTAGFVFGWAKPVPVNYHNLNNPRRDMALVALAGPFSNLLMALVWGFIAKIAVLSHLNFGLLQALKAMAIIGLQINILLFILNLLPIPPLDGSKVLVSIIPPKWGYYVQRYEQYGLFVLLLLLLTGVLRDIIVPIFSFIMLLLGQFFS